VTFQKLNVSALYTAVYGRIRKFDEDLLKLLDQLVSNLSNIFSQGVSLTENVDGQIVSFTTNGAANTEDTVAHTLKRIPSGFIVVSADKAASMYASGTSWTATSIYVKTSAASVAAKILIF
jgi:flagellar hook-associated protein FlgK